MKMGQPDVLTYTEYLSQLPSGSIVACDPKLMGAKTWITLKEKLSEVGVNLTSLSQNLIDEVWTEDNGRPPVNVRFAKLSRFFVRIPSVWNSLRNSPTIRKIQFIFVKKAKKINNFREIISLVFF